MKPFRLDANQPPRFFAGGEAIARLRGTPPPTVNAPEDWVASTTPLFGESEQGLSRLPDGRYLRDAVAADPEGFLGPDHAAAWGADPALLVKLLEAGQRLPVHAHPDREFARRHLDCRYGKTEAWVVAEVSGPAPRVYLGFRDELDRAALAAMVEAQDGAGMLGAMNEVPVAVGDAILVPAGLPHAIGAGVFVVELQEPTDFSVLMEWADFALDGRASGHLGLGFDVALDAVDRSAWDADRLDALRRSRRPAEDDRSDRQILLPPEADPFFRAERVVPAARTPLDAGFAVLVVLDGSGTLHTEAGGDLALRRGDTVLVPHAAGPTAVEGAIEVVRCRPPDPGVAQDSR